MWAELEGGERGGWEKISRAEDPRVRRSAQVIFGEPERPKPGSWADGAKMSQLTVQKIHPSPKMTNSAQDQESSRKW